MAAPALRRPLTPSFNGRGTRHRSRSFRIAAVANHALCLGSLRRPRFQYGADTGRGQQCLALQFFKRLCCDFLEKTVFIRVMAHDGHNPAAALQPCDKMHFVAGQERLWGGSCRLSLSQFKTAVSGLLALPSEIKKPLDWLFGKYKSRSKAATLHRHAGVPSSHLWCRRSAQQAQLSWLAPR